MQKNKWNKMNFVWTVKKFFSPVLQKPKWAIITALFSIILAWSTIFLTVCLQYLTKSIETKDQNLFFYRISTLWICFLIIIFSHFLIKLVLNRFIKDLFDIIDVEYPRKIMKLKNTFLEKQWTGRISSMRWKWIIFWIDMLVWTFSEYLVTLLIVIWSMILLVKKWFSLFWLIVWLLVCICWIIIFYRYSYKWRKKWKIIVTELDRQWIRIVMSKVEILQNNQIEYEIRKRLDMNNQWLYHKDREKFWQGLCYDWASFINYIWLFLLTFFTWFIALKNSGSVSDFVLVTWLGLWVISQVTNIVWIAKKLSDDSIHLEQLRTIFDDENNYMDIDSWDEFVYKKWNILIKKLCFSYQSEPQINTDWNYSTDFKKNRIFKDFSLEIQGGKKTAFVGESWWGKTTLIKLIAGYIQSDSWNIIIDGQNLNDVNLKSYYHHIWYLTQEPSVFDGTIYENLVYALDYKLSYDELEKTVRLAKCEFIFEFENKFETEIWERWIRLSGWQKQRLAIAKIMLKNPNIILLDEPTSALDSFNEELVSEALHSLFKWKMVIVVAHRLQTVKQADIIHYILDGKVIESGTHHELIKLDGKYKRMLDLQSWF